MPAHRFRSDANTTVLYHFDEGKGDVLKDSSGNDHHGKSVGANWVQVSDVPPVNASSLTPNAVARWVINSDGTVTTKFNDFSGHVVHEEFIGTIDALPENPSEIEAVFLPVKTRATAERIGDLAQLRGLNGLFLDFAEDGHVESDLSGLARLQSLQYLVVKSLNRTHRGNRLDGQWMKQLRGLSNLNRLELPFVGVTDSDLVHLKGLTSLEYLSLHGTEISDAGIGQVVPLRKLKSLGVGATHVGDDGRKQIASMTSLQELVASEVSITDVGLPHLRILNKLIHLYIQRTKVTAAGVSKLRQSLPACDIHSDFDGNVDLNRGLIGHWNFDEARGTAAKDSSANGHHATLKSMDESA
ncbi:MAG: hypothetical protein CMJ78_23545 [Planctomycetaceae bacterium]|nr:hypothetical protein [Planctomycetaceae bacterium]